MQNHFAKLGGRFLSLFGIAFCNIAFCNTLKTVPGATFSVLEKRFCKGFHDFPPVFRSYSGFQPVLLRSRESEKAGSLEPAHEGI